MSIVYDNLLQEIFLRLPDKRSLIQCSIVCKHWFSLLSDPQFIRAFHERSPDHPYTIFFGITIGKEFIYELFSENSKILHGGNHRKGNYLDFMPWSTSHVNIRASFEDLLLVSHSWADDYCICNPLTREWVALPRAPKSNYGKCGLMCERKGVGGGDKGLRRSNNINDQYRFKVLLITDCYNKGNDSVFDGAVFCSETGKWSPSVFSFAFRETLLAWTNLICPSDFVTSNGIFYSLLKERMSDRIEGIVAFDPSMDRNTSSEFADPKRCLFIRCSIDFGYRWQEKICFGAVQGRLRLSQVHSVKGDLELNVLELNYGNENGGEWVSVHWVKLQRENANDDHMLVAAFHPNNDNVIFMLRHRRDIYKYKMREKSYEIVGQLPTPYRYMRTGTWTLVHP
ncbi:F-box domain containing protein [Trema orientale]|uniref:F-box domain containing protein n=1 Tax=Trema orientale TaxID=63057 RepID=A0A2P5F6A5_TREOI|nr:F-box domain containing protein [Trema orientale]